jgi:16S rRNA processing protein RimM
VEIVSVRWHIPAMLVRLAGCETPEDTAVYRNKTVFVRVDELPPLPEGEYYHHQLIGLSVLLETGESLGELEQILETGANDVYLVRRSDGSEMLLPAIEDVIVTVNLERKEIVVRLQEWS